MGLLSSSETRAGKVDQEAVAAVCCTPASFARYHVGSGWRCSLAERAISTSQGVLCQTKSSGAAAWLGIFSEALTSSAGVCLKLGTLRDTPTAFT